MAGIGFTLRKILSKDNLTSTIRAYVQSSLVVAGPWILSSAAIFFLTYFKPDNISVSESLYFRSSVMYIFAFSLIFAGIFYMSLTRYIADRIYEQNDDAIIPAMNSAVTFTVIVQGILAGLFVWLAPGPTLVKLMVGMLYITLTMVWILTLFMTALKDYNAITLSFLVGVVIAAGGSLLLGHRYQVMGYYLGYLIGHVVLCALLAARVFIEFPGYRVVDLSVFKVLGQGRMVAVGFFFNLGTWADKLVFWWSPRATPITPFFRIFPSYEIAVFLAMLSIIPMLATFLIQVETTFYIAYRRYYQTILTQGTLPAILQAKGEMVTILRRCTSMMLKGQIVVTLLVMALTPEIIQLLDLPTTVMPILKITALGAFLQTLLLVTVTIMLYFGQVWQVLITSIVFFLSNTGFTIVTVFLPDAFLGYGLFAATFVSSITATAFLGSIINNLEYLTFVPQPIVAAD